jgi:glycosyltransferase involved in cell wall biosynthesis
MHPPYLDDPLGSVDIDRTQTGTPAWRDPRRPSGIELSVVVPLYNEAVNLRPLLDRLLPVLDGIGTNYEVILVDDGSRDSTWHGVSRAAAGNGAIRGVRLARNFGHQNALIGGLTLASGAAIVTMDGDLQHPPELVRELVERWRRGVKVVLTRRIDGAETGFLKRASSAAFYRVFSTLSEVEMSPGSSDFRLLDRSALEQILRLGAQGLFLRGAVAWLGFPAETVSFEVAPRHAGSSKYTWGRMIRFATKAIVSYSTKPLRLGIWLGLATSALAFLELCYIALQYARGLTVPGWASTVGIISLLFGILFIVLGIIGLYIAQIHLALQRRPAFLIDAVTAPVAADQSSKAVLRHG